MSENKSEEPDFDFDTIQVRCPQCRNRVVDSAEGAKNDCHCRHCKTSFRAVVAAGHVYIRVAPSKPKPLAGRPVFAVAAPTITG